MKPYNSPGKMWLIKSRRRVFMQAQEIYSFQQRDAGNYVLGMEDVLNMRSKANVTEGVLMVFHNPFVSSLAEYIPGGFQCQVTCTKTYHYTEVSSSVDAIGV